MKYPVDLARKDSPMCSPCCPPSNTGTSYPALYVALEDKDELDLPEEGTMTIKFRVRREEEYKQEGRCSYDIDVMEILDVTGAPSKPKRKDTEEVLDKYAKELE